MDQAKAFNVAIVGGGPGCKAIMEMIFAEKLSQLRMKLIGVASTNPETEGYLYAKEKGVFTTTDYRDLYKLKDLDMIIELTGRKEVAGEIFRTKPEKVRVMGNVAARLFWDVFQIEEQRIAERRQAEETIKRRLEFEKTVTTISSRFIDLWIFLTSMEPSMLHLVTWVGLAGRIALTSFSLVKTELLWTTPMNGVPRE